MDDVEKARKGLKELLDGKGFNPVALTIHQQVTKRIFKEGKNAKNSLIGKYAKSTLKTRRSPKNRGRVPQSNNIILEFTGQMRRDFIPIKDKGVIKGSGFKQSINLKKVKWIEKQQRQKIFALTRKEEKLFNTLLQKQVNKILDA